MYIQFMFILEYVIYFFKVSKVEETARMVDVEASFEDR